MSWSTLTWVIPMGGELTRSALLDTNIIILRRHLAPGSLQGELSISAVTLAELSAGVHLVAGDSPTAIRERANRAEILARTENEFDAIPFDSDAARMFGRLSAAAVAAGRQPRRRVADLMIAATAASAGMALYTMNPRDYAGLEDHLTVLAVPRPDPTRG